MLFLATVGVTFLSCFVLVPILLLLVRAVYGHLLAPSAVGAEADDVPALAPAH